MVHVHGVGLHGLSPPAAPLDLGNSGTSTRLLAGLLAGQPFASELAGDASLMRRPMRRVVEPLRQMQADIQCTSEGTLPIHIQGGKKLKAIDYALPVASAQLKSCLLLAGLYAEGTTCVHEPSPTRDHTERMLVHFSGALTRNDNTFVLPAVVNSGGGHYGPCGHIIGGLFHGGRLHESRWGDHALRRRCQSNPHRCDPNLARHGRRHHSIK
jgi:3-phosphoshikimate 1-carboxyvinyltransferase